MEPDLGTDPDQFEIHISDNESHAIEDEIEKKSAEIKDHVASAEPDLLRASLSDVVFTQSLQLSEMKIDFEDGDKNVIECSVPTTDSNLTKPDLLMAASPSMTPHLPVSALSQHSETPKEDLAADFEDAVDPPLLTSTLKATDEDSDDEFDFDLPNSKVDKGKSVRFSGGCDFEEPAKGVETTECPKEEEKSELSDKPKEDAVLSSFPSQPMGEKGDGQPVFTGAQKLENGDGPGQHIDIKPEQDEEEKEDRRHIITSTAADWDNVETVEAGFTDAQTGEGAELMSSVPPLLSFSDIWQYFRRMDHTAVRDKIQVTTEKKGLSGIVSRLFGPPRLHKDLHADREVVFCIAATAFNNGEEEHLQSLQTIYRLLTGSRFSCARYGSHWEEIGFQGRDPSTDLRGTGMLGLVQLVNFLQEDATSQLARDLYKLSLHPTQNFPFCVMCINISRITLQALRDGVLNRECNSQKKVMPVVNQFYAGTLLYLYRVWQKGKTISDSGFVIRDVENRAKKQSKDVFKDLQAYIAGQKAAAEGMMFAQGNSSGKRDDNVNFFNVVKSETKTAAELY
ncbi:uncharacterized protein LOC143297725 isoform X2 [Babylonia areolata]|uniref:uncharacterized protein LOC143297725 isoform X2 n=1 Tax=Babylonia areolata TaxID=304850 RepID=UPI003FD0FDE3